MCAKVQPFGSLPYGQNRPCSPVSLSRYRSASIGAPNRSAAQKPARASSHPRQSRTTDCSRRSDLNSRRRCRGGSSSPCAVQAAHLTQKTRPQCRQWWRRSVNPNSALQRRHVLAASSGCQSAMSSSSRPFCAAVGPVQLILHLLNDRAGVRALHAPCCQFARFASRRPHEYESTVKFQHTVASTFTASPPSSGQLLGRAAAIVSATSTTSASASASASAAASVRRRRRRRRTTTQPPSYCRRFPWQR